MKNFSYYYNIDYFKEINYRNLSDRKNKDILYKKLRNILNFKFTNKSRMLGNCGFGLFSDYPGILIGTGYLHDINEIKEGVKLGFSLDYTTGVPYIPGSSVKGVLKSALTNGGADYVEEILKKRVDTVKLLKDFENEDVFFDAEIECNNQKIFDFDYVTPHKNGLVNPKPIKFLKIKEGVKFVFRFDLKDSVLSKDEKLKLFKQIILDLGLGAKTNVGFGKFKENL